MLARCRWRITRAAMALPISTTAGASLTTATTASVNAPTTDPTEMYRVIQTASTNAAPAIPSADRRQHRKHASRRGNALYRPEIAATLDKCDPAPTPGLRPPPHPAPPVRRCARTTATAPLIASSPIAMHRRRDPAGPQHVGRADVAAPHLAQIDPAPSRQQKRERDRPDEIRQRRRQ